MAKLYNLARMTTATTGTGTITLGSAVAGFLSFAGAGVQNGDTVSYAIKDGSNSEIGRGVYTSSGTTLTRTVLKSTNSNNAISLSGSAEVFITVAAEDVIEPPSSSTDNAVARFDGTGGAKLQNSVVLIDDSGNITGVGTLVMSPGATANATAGTDRYYAFTTNNVNRFVFVGASSDAESGSNAGSNFYINRYNDAGGYLSTAITITRSSGAVNVAGALSKGSGTFAIDHPLDPANKDLIHGFVEAPRYDLIYRGKVQLVNGQAVVDIDAASRMTTGTFAALTQNAEVTSLCNHSSFTRVKASAITAGWFTITAENADSNDWVHWVVIAERADPFIKSGAGGVYGDQNGRLVPEQNK